MPDPSGNLIKILEDTLDESCMHLFSKKLARLLSASIPLEMELLFTEYISGGKGLTYAGEKTISLLDSKYYVEIGVVRRSKDPLRLDVMIQIEVPRRNPVFDAMLELTLEENGFTIASDSESLLVSNSVNMSQSPGKTWEEKVVNYMQKSSLLIGLVYSVFVPQQ